ncbi:MAG: amidohydrolase family protein [Planctomycetaceae bacterium]|nr:amidohydrolase family protein [Planctomycetaceae bacterium]
MDISKSCVAAIEGIFYKDVQSANRYLHKIVKKHKKKFLLFSIINPAFPGWKKDMDECVTTLKTTGVRLFPGYHGYNITDKCCLELLSKLQKLNIPVQIAPRIYDIRMHPSNFIIPDSNIKAIPQILKTFPKLRVCIINLKTLNEAFENVKTIRHLKNCFIDISFVEGVNCINNLIKTAGVDRIVFGSNTPLFISLSAAYKLKESNLNKQQFDKIAWQNAENFLGKVQ